MKNFFKDLKTAFDEITTSISDFIHSAFKNE